MNKPQTEGKVFQQLKKQKQQSTIVSLCKVNFAY